MRNCNFLFAPCAQMLGRPRELRGVMGRRPPAQTTRTPVFVSRLWTVILSWLSAYADQHVVVNARLRFRSQPTFQNRNCRPSISRPVERSAQSEQTRAGPQAAQRGERSCGPGRADAGVRPSTS